jgi:hypothetical protein
MSLINEVVKDLLNKYVGGKTYFHILDDNIKFNENVIQEMLSSIANLENKMIVLSGEIAYQVKKYCDKNLPNQKYFITCGSPRKGQELKTDIDNSNIDLSLETIFVDDTFYSGKTFEALKKYLLEEWSLPLDTCFVAYDGCKVKKQNVFSLFRYFDYHNLNGEKIKEF